MTGQLDARVGVSTRPTVTVAYAQTLDGRIAARNGSSQWISCQESLAFAHELRASHDAIVVGIGTVLADDPRLTVRLAEGPDPLRVVLDSRLRTPPEAAVLRGAAAAGALLATTGAADRGRRAQVAALGVTYLVFPTDERGRVALPPLLAELARRGVRRVLVEGGARVITSFLRARVVDRLVICVAPKLVGSGVEAVGDLDIARLADAVEFEQHSFRACGRDILFEGTPRRSPDCAARPGPAA